MKVARVNGLKHSGWSNQRKRHRRFSLRSWNGRSAVVEGERRMADPQAVKDRISCHVRWPFGSGQTHNQCIFFGHALLTAYFLVLEFATTDNSIKNQKIRFHELQTNLYSYYCLSKSVLDDILSFTIIESSAMTYVLLALHILSASAGNHAKKCVFPNEPRVAYDWDENCKLGCLETWRLVMFLFTER